MSARPLDGITILDLSRLLPGPLCTLHLADLGAEVIKIEQPGDGDYTRAIPPLTKNISTFFLTVNRNKRSVTLDLGKEEGREVLLKMVENAHVVVESFRPGALDKMNLSYEVLVKRNPAIILCSITGYGQTGPYKSKAGHDLNYLAYAGILRPTLGGGGKPAIPNFQIGDIVGGTQNAAMAILAALISQTSTGKGQHLDVSMLDGLLAHNVVALAQKESVSSIGMDTSDILSGLLHCYNLYKTKDDKYIALGALEFKFWAKFCQSINRDDLVSKHMVMGEESEHVVAELSVIFASKTRDEWTDVLDGADCCISPVNTMAEALEDPQVQHRRLVKVHEHSAEGAVTYFDLPFKSTALAAPENTQAPLLGEHTEEILKRLGYDQQSIEALKESGAI
ncbi:MAG TPA: CoA transferase [Flavobacteriales bacterium]|nr:CoA transferase [Flavobacteriales bacterium]HIO67947.1 CoA transferase [Flavobacteriales bacterium]